jgi:hypothetical protein
MVYENSLMKEHATVSRLRLLRHVTFQSHQRVEGYDLFEGRDSAICPIRAPYLALQIAPFEPRTKGIGATQFNVRFFVRGDIRSARMA